MTIKLNHLLPIDLVGFKVIKCIIEFVTNVITKLRVSAEYLYTRAMLLFSAAEEYTFEHFNKLFVNQYCIF